MLKNRVIPVLLVRDINLIKGERFDSWRAVGSPLQAVKDTTRAKAATAAPGLRLRTVRMVRGLLEVRSVTRCRTDGPRVGICPCRGLT